MSRIVQKFGGTSLANAASRETLAAKVKAELAAGNSVILVVSAMGREGDPYATDSLLGLTGEYARQGAYGPIEDLLASAGETISACVIAALLESRGLKAEPLTAHSAGIRGEGPFGDASVTRIDTRLIEERLSAGIIPVITGFQACDSEGRILTLGRGGSDTTAVAVGAALKSEFVDIYKDVPGVAKADPRIIPKAPFMSYLDYDAMFRLAFHGARVLHDKSAELAKREGITIRIRPTFDEGTGTRIGPAKPGDEVPEFIGLSTNRRKDGTTRLTAVFDAGRSAQGMAKSRDFAAREGRGYGAREIDSGDPDAASFECPTPSAGDFARALFAAIEG